LSAVTERTDKSTVYSQSVSYNAYRQFATNSEYDGLPKFRSVGQTLYKVN